MLAYTHAHWMRWDISGEKYCYFVYIAIIQFTEIYEIILESTFSENSNRLVYLLLIITVILSLLLPNKCLQDYCPFCCRYTMHVIVIICLESDGSRKHVNLFLNVQGKVYVKSNLILKGKRHITLNVFK